MTRRFPTPRTRLANPFTRPPKETPYIVHLTAPWIEPAVFCGADITVPQDRDPVFDGIETCSACIAVRDGALVPIVIHTGDHI